MIPLLWLDLETTHLNPSVGYIVEAAWIITDHELEVQGNLRSALIDAPRKAWQQATPVIKQMHDESGLRAEWVAAGKGKMRPAELGHMILRDLQPFWNPDNGVYLAGSNCDFERRWLGVHIPAVQAILSHRAVDVSRLRTAFEFWAGFKYERPDGSDRVHRAGDDIVDHVAEARFYQSRLKMLAAAQPQEG